MDRSYAQVAEPPSSIEYDDSISSGLLSSKEGGPKRRLTLLQGYLASFTFVVGIAAIFVSAILFYVSFNHDGGWTWNTGSCLVTERKVETIPGKYGYSIALWRVR
jgi:hypothetical protein